MYVLTPKCTFSLLYRKEFIYIDNLNFVTNNNVRAFFFIKFVNLLKVRVALL